MLTTATARDDVAPVSQTRGPGVRRSNPSPQELQLRLTNRALSELWCERRRICNTHPMGAQERPTKTVLAQAAGEAMVVDTLGGRMRVRWDEQAQATPHGQLVLFASSWPPPGCSTAGWRIAR
jgi:hypothetical protein